MSELDIDPQTVHLTALICITALKGVYFIPVVGKNNARGYPRGSRDRVVL